MIWKYVIIILSIYILNPFTKDGIPYNNPNMIIISNNHIKIVVTNKNNLQAKFPNNRCKIFVQEDPIMFSAVPKCF